MRRSQLIIYFVCTVLLTACGGSSTGTKEQKPTGGTKAAADSTIYGKCVDAAMHTLLLLTEKGDTLYFSLEDFAQERRADVQGGLLIDDKMAVIAELHDDLHFPAKIINLTTLQGQWRGMGRDFDIEEGGTVSSHVAYESEPYTTWKIFNGRLVLTSDTFDITLLSGDSLRLENEEGIYEYKRVR